MSVVAARWRHSSVEIACDGQATVGGVRISSPPKVLLLGDAAVGVTGDRLWQQALRSMEPLVLGDLSAQDEARADSEAWCEALADRWHAWGRERGHGEVVEGVWRLSGHLLAATPAGLWRISGTGSVVEAQEDYAATGYGEDVAMGALHCGASPLRAVIAAGEHALYCGPPYSFWLWRAGAGWEQRAGLTPRGVDGGP